MPVPLHTSDELHQRSGAKHHQSASRAPTMPAAGADADGLRCEVRSMRSVPHALYTLPSVAHVVAGYVRQLQDDFSSSLLLCRPAQRRVYTVPRDNKESGGKSSVAVAAGASVEEEEAYLLLRLCALEARQRRQRRRAGHRPQQQQNERAAAATAAGGRTSAARADSAPAATSMEDESDEEAAGCDGLWADAAATRNAKAHKDGVSHLQAILTEVDAQLLEMFAKAEAVRRRGGGEDESSGGTVLGLPTSALTPPLLSSLLRFKPLLRDMQLIARHVLLPRYAWPHHQREWVNVCEDVSVTLCDRLARYRNVLCSSNSNAEEEKEEEEKEAWRRRASSNRRRVVSADELERLWQTLWELLGAAWRQRDRLWGAYRYMQGPRQLPPLSLNGQAVLAVPPGVHASPILRDHHLRHLIHTAALATSSSSNSSGVGGAARAPAGPKLPPSLVAAHDEDSCGFGPFTSSDVGISAEARFVLRQPMAAALRLLRVCVPAAGRDALATSTSAFAGFKYVSEPVRRSQSPATSPAPASTSSSAAAPPPVIVPLFDPTEEDVRLRRAVPYMAPEVYLAQQLRRSDTAPVHRFSDDVWNTAVVVLEAALCGFDVGDPAQCHLSALTTPATADDGRRSGKEEEKEEASGSDASPDAMPPPSTPAAAVLGVPTDSVYADVLAVLASHHRVSQAAAHNFLYAALHHLQKALKALLVDGVEGEDARCGRDATSRKTQKQGRESETSVPPSPAVLAQEWVRYLCTHYDTDFVTRVLAGEVAARGLCWRRSERWNAFGMAHVTAATAPSPRAEMSSSSPLVAPPSPFGSACSESGSSWRGQRSVAAVHAPDALTSPSAVASSVVVAEEAGSVSAADAPGRAFRLRPPLTVTLPSRLDSISSLDVSLRSPLRCGSPTSATSPTVARLPQRLDRAVNSMDTPLMPLFGVPTWTDNKGSGGGEGLWVRLARFLRRRTASGKHQRTQQTNSSSSGSGSGGGAGGKANGAVADAADVDAVEEFLHLLYTCVCVALRRGDDDAGKDGDDGGRTRFAAVNHPFLRGVAERGLLTTYMAVCGCARDEEGQRRTHETALQLYVPTRALLVAMAQLEEEEGEQQETREGGDRLAVAADIIASLDQLVKRTGTLRTFIGDDVRAWEAARDVSRRERAAYPTYFSYAASMTQPPAPVRRARPAVEAVLTPMDLSLPVQLHHVAALQRLCLEAHGGDTASTSVMGSGGSAAHATQQVRAYLHSALLPTACGGISPFFAVPPTIRGAVWGCLLHVPPARKREAVFAHALQRTAAKPSLNDRQLAVDIPRCHAYHPLLSSARGSAQLQRLLRAWLSLHPRFAYWQGLDSVCAVLLTVSPHDEALVLAQLSAVVEQFIAHDEGGEEGLGSRSSLLQSPPLAQQQQQQHSTVATKPSMSDQLHRLTAVLRYCDPLLAHYLFSVLGCTPELYAISWLLTVFSHSLPTRKVYLLWDLLFSYGTGGGGGSGTCLVALCAAVVMHRRSRLLSCDFTGCLSAFGSGAAHLDVAAAVGDTRQLMSVLPPSVLAQPCAAEEESRTNTSQFLYSGGQRSATATATVNAAQLPSLSVEDLKAAWDVARRRAAAGASTEQQRQHWSDSGVYLVDVRPEAASDALLGAIHLPLQTASLSGGGGGLPPVLSGESFGSDTAERGEVSSLGGRRAQRRDDVLPAAGEGWGIVADQERLHEQQQLEREAQERHIADAAAELVRHLNNPAVAAIAPRGTEPVNTECTPNASGGGDGVLHGSPPWPVHPIVLKTSLAPHVVLVATGAVSYGSAGGFSGGGGAAAAADGEDVLLAHQLGLRLNACGVHNVSVLRGGAVAIRLAMPELVVPHSQRV